MSGRGIRIRMMSMDGAEFEADLLREGYRIVRGEFRPDLEPRPHAHDFDVRFLVLEGSITIVRGNDRHTYGSGDVCFVPAGTMHEEYVEAHAMRYIAGTRYART
jgi:quercetin dioxygenase-like cupin family protein